MGSIFHQGSILFLGGRRREEEGGGLSASQAMAS